jgi:hypothetical protein
MSQETMLADMRLAMVPASMARRPSRARSLRARGPYLEAPGLLTLQLVPESFLQQIA